MNLLEKLDRFLENTSANPLDAIAILYNDFIVGNDNPDVVLQKILEHPSNIGDVENDVLIDISNDDISNFLSLYFDLISATIKNLIEQNLDISEFYKRLYINIFEAPAFPHEEKDQVILLYVLLYQKSLGLPYYQAKDLLVMDEEKYKNIIKSIEKEISLGVYMLSRHFKSKTEETSQLYNIASKLKSKEEQIVFWSSIITIIKHFSRTTTTNNDE